MIGKGIWDKRSIWNPVNCECESHKSCDIGEYLDYENYKFRKKLVDKLVEECTENNEEVKLARISSAKHESVCNSFSTFYIVLFSRIFTRNIWIGTYFVYFRWYLKKDVICVRFGTYTQTTI